MSSIKKTLIGILFLGIVLFLETGVVRADTPENGWFVETEKTYYYVDGEKVVNCIREIDGDYYGFDSSGIMFCDRDFESRDGVMYYDSELGTPTRQTIISYRAKKDGKLYHNEWSINGEEYYLDDCTLAVNCVVQIGDEYYGFNEYGFMFENESFSIKQGEETNYYHAPWGGKLLRDCWGAQQRVYFTADGSAAKGLYEVDGITYLFSDKGVIRKKAVEKVDGVWYVSDENGIAEVLNTEDGWKSLNGYGYVYYMEQGDLLCNCVKQIEDDFYGFDENCMLYTNGYFTIRDEEDRVHHYYAKEDGKLYTDTWIDWKGAHYYYCDSNGEIVQGIAEIDGESYLFSDDGKLQIETILKIGDVWYAGDEEGHPILLTEGWNAAGEAWFYFENGTPVKSKVLWIRNAYYGFDENGKMYDDTGFYLQSLLGGYSSGYFRAKPGGKLYTQQWVLVDGRWYYYKKNGAAPEAGMYRICGKRYGFSDYGYLIISGSGVFEWDRGTIFITDENGIACRLLRGWNRIEDHWFYADSTEGYGYNMLHSGWLRWRGGWYYLDPESRVMQTGWRKIDGFWYYFHEDGSMASNEWVDGYWLSKSGAWKYQPKGRWRKNSKGWWFEDERGWYPKEETVKINGIDYFFNADGYLAE